MFGILQEQVYSRLYACFVRSYLAALAKEQHFSAKGSYFVDKLTQEMDISEPIEELITQ
jgi:hypothetical protein